MGDKIWLKPLLIVLRLDWISLTSIWVTNAESIVQRTSFAVLLSTSVTAVSTVTPSRLVHLCQQNWGAHIWRKQIYYVLFCSGFTSPTFTSLLLFTCTLVTFALNSSLYPQFKVSISSYTLISTPSFSFNSFKIHFRSGFVAGFCCSFCCYFWTLLHPEGLSLYQYLYQYIYHGCQILCIFPFPSLILLI